MRGLERRRGLQKWKPHARTTRPESAVAVEHAAGQSESSGRNCAATCIEVGSVVDVQGHRRTALDAPPDGSLAGRARGHPDADARAPQPRAAEASPH